MALSKIKEDYLDTTIAFGNSGLPLGKRKDIDQLAILARESKNPNLIKLFEELPSLAELKSQSVKSELKKSPAATKKIKKEIFK